MTVELRAIRSFKTSPYPGEVPPYSYLLTSHSDLVLPLEKSSDGISLTSGEKLGDVLLAPNKTPSAYVPIFTYGSNACPGRLLEKFQFLLESKDVNVRIAVIRVKATGVGLVWSCGHTRTGIVPYTLTSEMGATMPGHVIMLPTELLAAMDKSEGRGGQYYQAGRLTSASVEFDDGSIWRSPLTYLGSGSRGPLVVNGVVATPSVLSTDRAATALQHSGSHGDDSLLPEFTVIPSNIALNSAVDATGLERAPYEFVFGSGQLEDFT